MLLRFFRPLLLILAMALTSAIKVDCQIIYTKNFTEQLQAAHLDYYKPIEQWFHVSPKKKDAYLKYDLVVINQEEDVEVRYIIKVFEDDVFDQFPDIDKMRIVNHIASNNPEADIRMVLLEAAEVLERFNADNGSIHYFTPKISYSNLPFGAMITLYAKGKGTAYAIIVYSDESFKPMDSFHQLRFRE